MSTHDLAELSHEQLLRLARLQTDVIESGLDYERLKWLVAREVHTATESSGAVVETIDGDEMVYEAVSGVDESLIGMRISASDSLSGLAIEEKQTLASTDCSSDPRVDRAACERVGLRSMIVTPLLYNDIPLGVLKSLSNKPDFFTAQDAALMRSLSRILAAALYHARKQSETSLFQRATRDWLTGLANRGLFEDRARHDIALARRNGNCIAVFMLDINKFKALNDTHGHKIGDAVLQEAAARISQCIRQNDTAARLGGDEFALLLTSAENRDACEFVKERLEKIFEPSFSVAGKTLQVSVSSGFALSSSAGEELEDLLHQADDAMYIDKRRRQPHVSTSGT